MKLYVNGCSMTFGDELVGSSMDDLKYPELREPKTWSGRLGTFLNFDSVINDARPGSSNEGIVRRTLEFLGDYTNEGNDPKELIVIIGWSSPYRYEFWHDDHEWVQSGILWEPNCVSDYVKKHYKRFLLEFHSEEYHTARIARQLLLMQTHLKLYNIRHLFFAALEDFNQYPGDLSPKIVNQIDTRNVIWDIPFHRFVKQSGLPRGPKGHPLEEGHRAWAIYLKTKLLHLYPELENDPVR